MDRMRSVSFAMAAVGEGIYVAEVERGAGVAAETVENAGSIESELSDRERELLNGLMGRGGTIDLIIPQNAAGEEVWSTLLATCKVLSSMRQAANRLKPLLGRLIIEIQNRPELYRAHGYSTFNDFMSRGMEELLGVSRADAYQLKRLAENLPWITVPQLEELGYSKALLLAADSVAPRAKEIIPLIRSKSVTVQQAREIIEDKKLLERGETEVTTIVITTSKAVKILWDEFVKDPDMQTYAETKAPGGILARMMDECRNTWQAHVVRDRVLAE